MYHIFVCVLLIHDKELHTLPVKVLYDRLRECKCFRLRPSPGGSSPVSWLCDKLRSMRELQLLSSFGISPRV